MILRGLYLSPEQAYVLRDAVRTWRAEHERFGARQKLTTVLGVLEDWERVADVHGRRLLTQSKTSDSGRTQSSASPTRGPLPVEPISTAEAGRRLDVTARHVRRLIEIGELEAITVGRAKLVDPASVEHLRQLRRSA